MKKKNLRLGKLSLNKETITELNNKAQACIAGGKVLPPVSGTGCGCDMKTCGKMICITADCTSDPMFCIDPG